MSSRTLYRLSGGALIIGSLLIFISSALSNTLFPGHEATLQQRTSLVWIFLAFLSVIGSLLFLVGVPGFYLRQVGRVGTLGLIGFILLSLGVVLQGVCFSVIQATIMPWLAQKDPVLAASGGPPPLVGILLLRLGGLTQISGAIILGIATLRARVFPRWIGILLLIFGIAYLLSIGPFLGNLLEIVAFAAFAVAFLWSGYLLITREQKIVEEGALSAIKARASL